MKTSGKARRIGRRAVLAGAAGLLAGCSGGIFGGSQSPQTRRAPAALAPVTTGRSDSTVLLPDLRLFSAERGRQGVILRAEAVAPTQGFHTAELRPVGRGEDGIETVELRAQPPFAPSEVGPERTRLIAVARFYSSAEMRDIRGFRVITGTTTATTAVP